MKINSNINAHIAANALSKNQRVMGNAMERLSTGVRINSARDDAAGLAITSKMTSQINGLKQAVRNTNDAISMLQVAEGATVEITNMLQRMRELAVQAANGANTANDREALDKEFQHLSAEIDRISKNTQWNGKNLLDGTGFANGTANFQIGANADQTIEVNLGAISRSMYIRPETETTLVKVGAEFKVHTDKNYVDYGLFNRDNSSVASLADGGFVVTWTSSGDDGSYGVFGQRYASDGMTKDAEFQVSNHGSRSVIFLADGGFVVTTASLDIDGSDHGISGQRYASDGTTQGAEFQVNTHTNKGQHDQSVASLADGGFVVTWQSDGQDGSDFGIYGQRYASDDTTQGAEFQVNTHTDSRQYDPSVTSLNDGGFVVTWTSLGQDTSVDGVYGQRYASDGTTQGAEFQVNTHTHSYQSGSSVTSLADGGFVVTWHSEGQDGGSYGIYGQRYASDGTTQGAEFQVNTHTNNQQMSPAVTSLTDGGFVITWNSVGQDGSRRGIYGQRYASDGTTQDAEFQVNTHTNKNQYAPSVASLADGGFVVTWTSVDQDGDMKGGIYGQRYLSTVGVQSIENATAALEFVDNGISFINELRTSYGATMNRLEYAADNLTNIAQNTEAAKSRILDTDYASETTELARTQIIQQAATAMLTQANQQAKYVLELLKSI